MNIPKPTCSHFRSPGKYNVATAIQKSLFRILAILAMLCVFTSCENGMATERYTDNKVTSIQNTDTAQNALLKGYKEKFHNGKKVFNMNCAVCHCGPGGLCEPGDEKNLRSIFDTLPLTSLQHFTKYIQDTSNHKHPFNKVLTETEAGNVILFLWLGYRNQHSGS